MASEFRMERTVTFAETDMAGILHFSNYYRYMEEVEHAFFRSLGLRVHEHSDSGVWGWARGEAACTFRQPLHYEDVVELHLVVREKRRRTIRYEVIFRLANPADPGTAPAPGSEVARGTMTVVCVSRTEDGSGMMAVPMPAEVDSRIDVAPEPEGHGG